VTAPGLNDADLENELIAGRLYNDRTREGSPKRHCRRRHHVDGCRVGNPARSLESKQAVA